MTFEGFSSYLAVTLVGFVAFLASLGAAVVYIFRRGETQAVAGAQGTAQARQVEGQRARPVNRAQAGVRRRQRAAAAAAAAQAPASDESDGSEGEQDPQPRQQVPQIAKTAREAYEQRRRKKDADREAAEALQEAELARAAAARAAKQEAEAAEWMCQISMEEQGQETDEEQEGQGLLGQFVDYIKERKSVALEDLAAQFGLRVQDAITRVQSLEKTGQLTGVMDDRGKYIYISTEEMKAVAEYIKRRGRIAIGELAAKSNTFIDLEAKATAAPAEMMPDLGLDDTVEVVA
ncbi:hypothetical protein ABBQ38_001529 [Trebouxia sp. C0009 RCD-2024]